MKKFKLIFLLCLTLLSIFGTTSYATPRTLDEATMTSIINELGMSKTEDNITAITNKFNTWSDTQYTNGLEIGLNNIIFFTSYNEPNTLKFTVANLSTGGTNLEHLYIDFTINSGVANGYKTMIWKGWSQNSTTGQITGVSASEYNTVYWISESAIRVISKKSRIYGHIWLD